MHSYNRTMQPRTKRQKDVLDYIILYIEKHGYEPSYQQIARRLGMASKAGVAKHIEALESQGLISRRRENGCFKLELLSSNAVNEYVSLIEWLDVPKNETLVDDWENEPLFIPNFMLGFQTSEKLRAFRVRNDSMLDEHICEGDIILLEERNFARDGDIVVALTLNKRVVLKKYFRSGANIELRPANLNFAPLLLPADKVSILGVLRGVLRPLN